MDLYGGARIYSLNICGRAQSFLVLLAPEVLEETIKQYKFPTKLEMKGITIKHFEELNNDNSSNEQK